VDQITVKTKSKAALALYSSTGEVVLEEKARHSQVTLNVSTLPSGVYILKVDDGATLRTFKVFKQ
jgi:hypothetical protein